MLGPPPEGGRLGEGEGVERQQLEGLRQDELARGGGARALRAGGPGAADGAEGVNFADRLRARHPRWLLGAHESAERVGLAELPLLSGENPLQAGNEYVLESRTIETKSRAEVCRA